MIPPSLFGALLALFSSLCFALNRALLSRPLLKSDPTAITYITNGICVIIVLCMELATQDPALILQMAPTTILIFAGVGVLQFSISRILSLTAVKNIGANQTAIITPTQILYAFFFAVALLGEDLKGATLAGGLLIVVGTTFMEGRVSALKRGGKAKVGVTAAILASVIYGLVPVFIKAGLSMSISSVSALSVSFVAAVLFNAMIMSPGKVVATVRLFSRPTAFFVLASGVFIALAQLLRFAAYTYSPVTIAAPMTALSPIFIVLLTRVLAREYEVFHARTVASTLVVVCGAVLVAYSSGIG